MLYWCDARTDKIERINLETGENREVVLGNNNMDMFSVSVFESYIYWSDRSDTTFLLSLIPFCESYSPTVLMFTYKYTYLYQQTSACV